MFLVSMKVSPNQDADDFQEFGGAYFHCWVDFAQAEGAIALANYYLDQHGWQAVDSEEVEVVTIEHADVENEAERRQYFEEAETYGLCFVYYTWPRDSETDAI